MRGYLGVMIQTLTPDLAAQLKVPFERGSVVAQVQPGSPADKAGLQTGDVIVKIAEKEVPDTTALRNLVARQEIGAKIPVSFYRAGKLQTVAATIDEQPGQRLDVEPLGFRLLPLPPAGCGKPRRRARD